MAFWLFKSEPSDWSWQDQLDRGDQGEEWSGVRNYQARNFMRQMQLGDLGFFYHSQAQKAIVGIVRVIATSHPDSTSDDDRWECVDICAHQKIQRPMALAEVKKHRELSEMMLLRNPRLSVQPVTSEQWEMIGTFVGPLESI